MKNHITIIVTLLSSINMMNGQLSGYQLDVEGYSGSDNQISIISLWQGSSSVMVNTSGADLTYIESGIDPIAYDSSGNIEVKLIIRITASSAGINNFQLRTHDGTTEAFPIVNTDGWIFSNTQVGQVAVSPWKDWSAGTNIHEVHLYGWVDAGATSINSVYLMIRPDR